MVAGDGVARERKTLDCGGALERQVGSEFQVFARWQALAPQLLVRPTQQAAPPVGVRPFGKGGVVVEAEAQLERVYPKR